MRNLIAASLVLATLSFAAPGHARQAAPVSTDACATAATTIDFEKCQAIELDKANQDLAGLTAKINAHLATDAKTKQAFDAAQAAWREDVNRTCGEMDSVQFDGGTAHLTEPGRCAIRMTRERTALLNNLFYVMLND